MSAAERSLDELTLGGGVRLEDLVDRTALSEMAKSFFDLFGVPLRIFAEDGTLLADAFKQPEVYDYLNGTKGGRKALGELVARIKALDPGDAGEVTTPCVTGAAYRVVAISYDHRRIGRAILGPFLPPDSDTVPATLLELDPVIDPTRVLSLREALSHLGEDAVGRIAAHLRHALDLILFSGHKALLTSNMHLASVRESYRELKEKNARLEEAYNRLKELDRLKSNFLATVSHELRTPLTSIIGYSEMLLEGIAGDVAGEQREFVQTIHEKGGQLLQLIMGLLDLSKLESGTMSMRRHEIEPAAVVQEVFTTLAPTARKKGVILQTELSEALPLLHADPERLRQVLLNLTENAIKFTPPDGTVTIGAKMGQMTEDADAEGGGLVLLTLRRPAVVLSVADTGIGIPEHERGKVFDAFYQVDSSSTREAGGTGLGLSIVKRLVEAHDGNVRIDANMPRGAVFVVTLPLKRASVS